jgi:hypothetical protein
MMDNLVGKRIIFTSKIHSDIPYGRIGVIINIHKSYDADERMKYNNCYDVEFEGTKLPWARGKNLWYVHPREC